jgi:hypothetical protein
MVEEGRSGNVVLKRTSKKRELRRRELINKATYDTVLGT